MKTMPTDRSMPAVSTTIVCAMATKRQQHALVGGGLHHVAERR